MTSREITPSPEAKALLEQIDPPLCEGALEVVQTLFDNGHAALFAGGIVRDLLMKSRVSDIDIATSAKPEEVQELFEKTIPVGKQFGVIVVVLGDTRYEVTTFREEDDYLDGRHPSNVTFSDARRDASRRDFTVNGLYLEPVTGHIFDFVGGRDDLELRVIRTIGDPDKRFAEDKLRVLRAIRFACQLDFEIDPKTWQAIPQFVEDLEQVSWERHRDEFLRILTGPAAARGLRLLLESGILAKLLPEVAAMDGVEQPPQYHPEGDVFTHTCLMFDIAGQIDDPALALGVLLHDVGKPPTFKIKERIRFDGHAELGAVMAREICERLRLPGKLTDRVVGLVRDHLRFIPVKQMRESTLKRFLRRDDFDTHMALHRLDCLGSHGDMTAYEFCREKLAELQGEQIRPPRLVTGHDLREMGLPRGPIYAELLRAVEDAQLEGRIATREGALDFLKKRIRDCRH